MATTLHPAWVPDLLHHAVQLAVDNAHAGREPFGALVVHGGEVVAEGVNTGPQDSDPTAHAEVAAVRAACKELGTMNLAGATVVSSCEPCAMCLVVCTVAGIEQIVYAADKEMVPDLDGPPRPELPAMQEVLRGLTPAVMQHVPVPDAAAPFAGYR